MKIFLAMALAICLFSNASAFSVEPNRIAYSYSQEQFSLPVVEIRNDAEAKHLSVAIECEKNFDCLKDYCSLPSNLFLLANEVKQVQFYCILQPKEERILVGRALFLPQDSNSSDQNVLIELVKASSDVNTPVPALSFEAIFGKDTPLYEFEAGEHHIALTKSALLGLLAIIVIAFFVFKKGG
jgi:hypothetical protein